MNLSLVIQVIVTGLSAGAVYALMAVGLQVIIRTTGVINFAHGQFYTIGAYAFWATYCLLGLNIYVCLALTIIVLMLLGALSYSSVFAFIQRRFVPGTGLEYKFLLSATASIGLMMLFSQSILLLFGSEERGIPPIWPKIIIIANVRIPMERLVVIVSCLLIGVALYLFFVKTKLGKAMRAVSADPVMSSLLGINSARIYLLSFSLGCGLAGFAGLLLAPVFGVSPEMGTSIVFFAFLAMLFGGSLSYKGAIVGGLVLGLMISFGYQLIGSVSRVFVFAGVIIFLICRPGGLTGEVLS
ncbi:MAG: branched-chain amino acid ABC transporter permease [candidate division Zixibacteria bacterium]|nr:branched-chain amino acid ABC transporter permease [candidate division Zixibacteria bacterium]